MHMHIVLFLEYAVDKQNIYLALDAILNFISCPISFQLWTCGPFFPENFIW